MLGVVLAVVTAQGVLVIQTGETATFHLEGGRPVLERAAPDAPPRRGSLRASLANDVPGGPSGAMLILVNGTEQALDYRASMSVRGQTASTSVCTVMPNGKMGIEHWPHRVDALALGEFRPHPGATIECR